MDRLERQSGIIPNHLILNASCMVIGVGAIGRQVALQLASVGVRTIKLVDFDDIEEVNITTQGYYHHQKGMPKVNACADTIMDIDPGIIVHAFGRKYGDDLGASQHVFLCVDRISTRQDIWHVFQSFPPEQQPRLLVDGRMLGESGRIVTISDENASYYQRTMFNESDTEAGSCTTRATIYSASFAASMMVGQFTKHLRGERVDKDLMFNMKTNEIMVHEEEDTEVDLNELLSDDGGPTEEEVTGPRLAEIDEIS